MINLPDYIIDEVTSSGFGVDDMEYKICDPKSKWFEKFSFHDKLFFISKVFNLFDYETDWDDFEKVVALIDEKEFYSLAEKFNGVELNYDGSDEDLTALKDVLLAIRTYSEELCEKLSAQENEETCAYAASPYFFCTIFHCFSPDTVFAANKEQIQKSRLFYDSDETLLHYDEVPDDFKQQLKQLFKAYWEKFLDLDDGNKRHKFMPRDLFTYNLRAYTLCQAISSTRWGDFELNRPYPVITLSILKITGRAWKRQE